ncbi:MAG: hypothetical protein LBS60_09030 [Deltaproteobacteria bacterium]|nr:hypothetical protein [Deltaproteobacteria bacterium]
MFADYYAGVIQYTMNGIDWEEQTKTPVSSSGLYNLDMYYAFSRYFLTGIAGNSAQNIFVLSGDLTGNFGGPWTSNNVYTRDHVVDSGYVFTFTCNNHNAIHVAVRRTFNTYVASNTINPFVNFSADYTFFAGESKPMRDFFVYEYGGTNILHRMAGNLVSNTLTISEVSSCPVTDSLASWGKFVEGFGRYKDRILLTLSTDGSRGAFSTDLGASFKPFTLSEDLQTSYMMNPHTRLWSYFTKGYRLRYHPASGKWFLGTGTSGIFELIPYYAGEENG